MRVDKLKGMQDAVKCSPLASLWFSAAYPSLWNKAQPACSDAEVSWPHLI